MIEQNYGNLTRKQKEVLDILLANQENVGYASLKELSAETKASEVTILRMCRKLGFENYIEFRQAFRDHTEHLLENVLKAGNFPMILPTSIPGDRISAISEICQDAHTRSEEFYNLIRPEDIQLAASRILQAKTVLICVQGSADVLAEFLFRRLNPLVKMVAVVQMEDLASVQANLLKLREGDNVIVIDFPRYYMSVRNIVQFAEHVGATVTAVTDEENSPVVSKNSLNFFCSTKTKVFYNSYSLPMEIMNLIASGVVLEMGSAYNELVLRSHELVHSINLRENGSNFSN